MSIDSFELVKNPISKQQPTSASSFDGLSFNVGLSKEQKETKDSLQMPYWKAQEGPDKNPIISYFHDKDDDFDEDDPDEDLEF